MRNFVPERIVRAMNNPYVRTIAHPTGRILNRREPYAVNVSRLIGEAKATNTALELNSYVDRLDLSVPYIRESVNAGVKITLDTDAHDETALSFAKFGVSQARRAWVEKESVINCMSWEGFEEYLKRGAKGIVLDLRGNPGGLLNAGYTLQGPDFPSGLVGVMQGIILFCALGAELLLRYRVRFPWVRAGRTLAEGTG
jgi:hypothetical protein